MTLFQKFAGMLSDKLNPPPPRDHWNCRAGDHIVSPDFAQRIEKCDEVEETIKSETDDGEETVKILYRDLLLENDQMVRVELLDSPDHTQKVSLILFSEIWSGPFDEAVEQGITASLEGKDGFVEDGDGTVYQILGKHEMIVDGAISSTEWWCRLAATEDLTVPGSLLYFIRESCGWHRVHRGNQVLPETYQVIEGSNS
jgi:hypothetical protein